MLFWALRWHEGRRVSWRVLCDVLWGDFGRQAEDPIGSIRELMAIAQKRYADQWIIDECNGRSYKIAPRPVGSPRNLARLHRSPYPPARRPIQSPANRRPFLAGTADSLAGGPALLPGNG